MVGVVKLHVEKMEQQKVIAIGSFVCVCVRACICVCVCVCVSTGLACELNSNDGNVYCTIQSTAKLMDTLWFVTNSATEAL